MHASVEFIPLQLPTTVSFKCVLISINFSAWVMRTNLVTSTCPVSTLYFNISIDFLIEMKVASHELS